MLYNSWQARYPYCYMYFQTPFSYAFTFLANHREHANTGAADYSLHILLVISLPLTFSKRLGEMAFGDVVPYQT